MGISLLATSWTEVVLNCPALGHSYPPLVPPVPELATVYSFVPELGNVAAVPTLPSSGSMKLLHNPTSPTPPTSYLLDWALDDVRVIEEASIPMGIEASITIA